MTYWLIIKYLSRCGILNPSGVIAFYYLGVLADSTSVLKKPRYFPAPCGEI
jgi:hypothetical protein